MQGPDVSCEAAWGDTISDTSNPYHGNDTLRYGFLPFIYGKSNKQDR